MANGLSIQLDISNRRIVIVGGGAVAARKAATLLAAGASDLTAIAPAFAADFPPGVRRIIGAYQADSLTGASLVFAATDKSEVNDAVVRDARLAGAWANRVDAGDADFTTPASADLGDIRITISAGSAALSAAIRDQVAKQIDPRWLALAAAMKTLRPWIVGQAQLSAVQRADIFRKLASEDALVYANDLDSLKKWTAGLLVSGSLSRGPSPGVPGERARNASLAKD